MTPEPSDKKREARTDARTGRTAPGTEPSRAELVASEGGSSTHPRGAAMTRETRAQALVLESILMHQPLPGMDRVLTFPDLGRRADDAQVVLIDDRNPSELGFPTALRMISRDELDTIRSEAGLRYLEFVEPEPLPDKISVRVQLSVASPDGGFVPLEGMVATFDDSDPLSAVEPTNVVAF